MSDHSKIEWTEASWPVTVGCDHVSNGCDSCYAAQLASTRLRHLPEYAGLAEGGRFNGTVRCLPERLDWPLKWRKPRRVFVCSMSDLFHEAVPDEFIVHVFDAMLNARRHTFQVLTKRHARMRSFVTRYLSGEFATEPLHLAPLAATVDRPPANIWLGVSVEDQKWADIRIPALLGTPAAVRFVSAEPLIGPLNLAPWLANPRAVRLSWVIAGGESGPGARRMEENWVRALVWQCHAAKVPLFVKQMGRILGREFGAGSKGGDWDRWPEDLRVREFPRTPEPVTS